LTKKEPKGQGLVARLNCLLISGNKTNSLRSDKSDCLSEIIDNSLRLAQPRPFYRGSVITPLQSSLISPVKQTANEDKRNAIIKTATAELGVREVTGNNDGPRIEEYLAYTHLSKGYEWCAAFVSWCYGQVGLEQPRNPWSPALFPKSRLVDKVNSKPADVFGIYSNTAKRIHHVGLIKELQGSYIISIEGNSNNRVESRRRHLRTIHSIANWID
jgi:cell wall-associated NlpC family hydrolase